MGSGEPERIARSDEANADSNDDGDDGYERMSRDIRRRSINVLYTNAQSVVNKIEEMKAVASIYNPDVIILTETWTNDSVSNEYLSINGYEIIERMDRNDTDKGRGGGIVVYVMKDLCAWKIKCDSDFNQYGMVGIKLNNKDLKILTVYRSPNSVKTNDDELCKLLEKMNGLYVIFGDFNFPDISLPARRKSNSQ